MDILALETQENSDFAFARLIPGWIVSIPIAGDALAGQSQPALTGWEFRMEITPANSSTIIATLSTANGRAILFDEMRLLLFSAPRADVGLAAGAYQHRTRLLWSGGELALFGGSLQVRRAITRGW
jgi:hypothetical protein